MAACRAAWRTVPRFDTVFNSGAVNLQQRPRSTVELE